MNKFFGLARTGLKYTFYCTTAISISAYAYLQYVNSQLGPIRIDKDNALNFYKEHHKMGEAQAARTYYWVMFHISVARIMKYAIYKRSCDNLNTKIIQPAFINYQKQGIWEEISTQKEKGKPTRWIFSKITEIRKLNADNIELREYVIRDIRTCQKQMYTNVLLGISDDSKSKIDKIHQYICQTGRKFRDPEITKYVSKLPEIEDKYPGDYLHKILFI